MTHKGEFIMEPVYNFIPKKINCCRDQTIILRNILKSFTTINFYRVFDENGVIFRNLFKENIHSTQK